MAEIKSPRRFYLGQRIDAAVYQDWPLVGAWRSKQEAQPGTSLPVGFPHIAKLSDAGYTTEEDLDGADECELIRRGFNSGEATAILAAAAAL